mmetsp:Transcript_12657/g.33405  ORF Transcript_12657/g.33405 Transcript_12657/m.33405 type:complete len:220 (-) Transcript_12657:360-1019(-)
MPRRTPSVGPVNPSSRRSCLRRRPSRRSPSSWTPLPGTGTSVEPLLHTPNLLNLPPCSPSSPSSADRPRRRRPLVRTRPPTSGRRPTGAPQKRSSSPCRFGRPSPRPYILLVVRKLAYLYLYFSHCSSRRPGAPTAVLQYQRRPPRWTSLDATSGSHSCARPGLRKPALMYPANSRRPSWARPSRPILALLLVMPLARGRRRTGKSDRRRRARRPRRGP